MKTPRLISIVRATLMAGIVALGSFTWTASAIAQIGGTVSIVNIPFDFQTDTQKMPAGLYRIAGGSSDRMVVLRGPGQPVMVMTHAAFTNKPYSRSYVIFKRIGDSHFLEEIWDAGAKDGLVCYPGHTQKELEKLAKKQSISQITLALSSPPQ